MESSFCMFAGRRLSVIRLFGFVFAASILLTLPSCGGTRDSAPLPPGSTEFTYNFAQGAQGWIAGASDYPVSYESAMDITTGITGLPAPLDQTRSGYRLAGNNNSDDLFLYIKKQISGLKPNSLYALTFSVTFATNATSLNVMDIKAGATSSEPNRVVTQTSSADFYLMNIDKGNQRNSGKDAVLIGTNTVPNESSSAWQLKTLNSTSPFTIKTDQNGAAWLIVGGECTFEVWNEIYYTSLGVTATPN